MALITYLAFLQSTEPAAELTTNFEVVASYPHDETSFTQGLEFAGETLIESSGRYGQSEIRVVNPTTGETIDSLDVDPQLFAEGTTIVGDHIFQLTWKTGTVLTYELDDSDDRSPKLELTDQTFSYDGQGWGLCETDAGLLRSDGTRTLKFHDKGNFEELFELELLGFDSLTRINELECTGNRGFANVFETNTIVEFDLTTGEILRTLDLSALVPASTKDNPNAVLNGIAIHPTTQNLWVTGKLWPQMFELNLSTS